MKAISAGLFPSFLKQDDINAEKDYASFSIIETTEGDNNRSLLFSVKESVNQDPYQFIGGPTGALNGLHLKGYNVHENELDLSPVNTATGAKVTYMFSRRRHSILHSDAADIFTPDNNERNNEGERCCIKQFALQMMSRDNEGPEIRAPSEFHEDESVRSNPFGCAIITQCDTWLEDNGFTTREREYEAIFKSCWVSITCQLQVFFTNDCI